MTELRNTDFLLEVNKGNIPGNTLVHKFGWRGNNSVTHFHIWNSPVAQDMIFPTVAETLDVVSASANDTAGGTGARKVYLQYLDQDFVKRTTTVIMNGATPVTTIGFQIIRLIRAYVTDCGAYGGTNEGLIIISGTDTGNPYGYLEAGEAQTQNTQYCIPSGKTGYILRASMTVESNKLASFELHIRQNADAVAAPFTSSRVIHQWDGIGVPYGEDFNANHIMPAKTDIWIDSFMSTGTGLVQFDYDILLVDN